MPIFICKSTACAYHPVPLAARPGNDPQRTIIHMGSLKKRRKTKINKHKRKKRMKANRHKKRLRYKS